MCIKAYTVAVFVGPVYKVESGAIDGLDVFDKMAFDISISGGDGPGLFDNLQHNTVTPRCPSRNSPP